MLFRRAVSLLGLAAAMAETNQLQSTALKTLFDIALPMADLTSAEKETLANMFEGCDGATNVLSPLLDDVVATASNCSKVAAEKTTNSILSSSDKLHMTQCVMDAKTLFSKHGGINFLAVPALTAGNKATLKSCAGGVGSSYGEAMKMLVQRYTACTLSIGSAELAIMNKIVPSEASTDAENSNQIAVRNICNSMDGFETMNGLVVDFATNTAKSFIDGLHMFSTNNERRRR